MPYIIDENGNISKGDNTPEKVDGQDHGYISDDYLEGGSSYSIGPTYIADNIDDISRGIARLATEEELIAHNAKEEAEQICSYIVDVSENSITTNIVLGGNEYPVKMSRVADDHDVPYHGTNINFMYSVLISHECSTLHVFKEVEIGDKLKYLAFKLVSG